MARWGPPLPLAVKFQRAFCAIPPLRTEAVGAWYLGNNGVRPSSFITFMRIIQHPQNDPSPLSYHITRKNDQFLLITPHRIAQHPKTTHGQYVVFYDCAPRLRRPYLRLRSETPAHAPPLAQASAPSPLRISILISGNSENRAWRTSPYRTVLIWG